MHKFIQALLAVSLIFVLFALSGCNTFKGIGEDIESLGESMQNTAE
jgi:predicted small secreted protein